MEKVAIYARYSCEQQRETSIEDQVRRCREVAARYGFIVDDSLIFTDAALSGRAYAENKREGYNDFKEAWKQGKIDVFLTDEFSRLSRDAVEQALLTRKLEKNRRVRMITADGIDTNQADWQLRLGLQGVLAQQEIRKIQDRVGRGMVGQLERGFMVAAPPFGYDLKREFDAAGNRIGTHWTINEKNAAIVQAIFARRVEGQSMHKIAAWLNEEGIACSRKARKSGGGFWRPSRVRIILTNTIYRGEFRWNGSPSYISRAKAEGREIQELSFARPMLRIVSDEVWYRCNSKLKKRATYGGGKNALAGIFTCGCCGGTLVLSSHQKTCRSLYCASCTVAKSTAGQSNRMTGTVAVPGAQVLLTEALRYFLNPIAVEAFRNTLRELLSGDATQELQVVAAELTKLKRTQERLSHILAGLEENDPILEERYKETKAKVRDVQTRLDSLSTGAAKIDFEVIQAQLDVEPATIIDGLFNSDVAPERLRSVIARLFPSIVLEGKESRYKSIFRLCFAPGAASSIVSQTEVVTTSTVELRFKLTYTPDNPYTKRENKWEVTPLIDLPKVDSQAISKNLMVAEMA